MSSKNNNNNNEDHGSPQYQPQFTGGMTPSIITTINNTSPTPLFVTSQDRTDETNSQESRSDPGTKNSGRAVEPPPYYESYIEDSFVGHWEHEDDDPEYDHGVQRGPNEFHQHEADEEPIHPSTIEFDFDSFGPESFIYTPPANAPAATSAAQPLDADSQQVVSVKTPEKSEPAQEPGSSFSVSSSEQKEEPKEVTSAPSSPKPVNSPKICELRPSPVDYLVDPAQIDLKVIEPYKKVISHAGYCHHFDPSASPPNSGEPAPAIIVFSACYLPDRSRRDYDYVMDHLFLYVLSSLHELIADDYILIYLHNTQPSTMNSSLSLGTSSSSHSANGSSTHSSGPEELHQNNLPTFNWMKRCYQMIDRRLRKNLKVLYLVKPTFWLKTIVIMCRPFISSKFSKKLRFIENMDALRKCLPVDRLILPASADCL